MIASWSQGEIKFEDGTEKNIPNQEQHQRYLKK
jgi:hypothetical protein